MNRRALFPLLALLFAVLAAGCGGELVSQPSPDGSSDADSSRAAGAETTVYGKTTQRDDARSEAASSSVARSGNARAGNQGSPAGARANSAQAGATSAPALEKRESGVPFVDSPQASGGTGSEADSILAVRYGAHEDYERVVLDLGAGKMPAESVPEWTLNSPAGDGLLRITFPSVSVTRVSDRNLGGLVRDFHVVRAPESGMFVDMLSRSAFIYRVMELSNPARLVVDFKPSPSDAQLQVPLPTEGGNTVLIEPRAGASVGDPLIVSGYSRNPEAMNTIILKGPDGKTLIRDSVQSNDWSSTWGYFETTLAPPPFSGKATLMVGANSSRDGSFQGVEVPVNEG